MASHAYHLVCLAQEKAETQDKIDELLKRLAVEETELEGLHSAVALMKNSNVKYRDGLKKGPFKSCVSSPQRVRRVKNTQPIDLTIEHTRTGPKRSAGINSMAEAAAKKCKF